MITSGILILLLGFLGILLSPFYLLPDVSLPANVVSAISSSNGLIASIYLIAPYTITALLAVLVLVIIIEGFIMGWKVINWILHKIPGIS